MKVHLGEEVIQEGTIEGEVISEAKSWLKLERVQNERGCSDLH